MKAFNETFCHKEHFVNNKVSKFEPFRYLFTGVKNHGSRFSADAVGVEQSAMAIGCATRSWLSKVPSGKTNEATSLVGSEQFNEMSLPLDPSKPWFICF